MDLSTIVRVKALLELTGSANDTLLTQLLVGTGARVERYLQRLALTVSRTVELFPDEGETEFPVQAFPITSVTSVKYQGTAQAYVIDKANGIIILQAAPTWLSYGILELVYTGGMGADTTAFIAAFPDIAHAVDLQMALLFQRRKQLGATTVADIGGRVVSDDPIELCDGVRKVLDLHRRVII